MSHGEQHGHPLRDKDGNPLIERYNPNERTNHWITAITFVMLALSGLAMFHPSMAWLALIFGGGQWTRILHPFAGLVMFVSFAILVLRFWHHNKFEDGEKIGKYNAGQKILFFVLLACMCGLLLSGIVIWRAYFAFYFPIPVIRAAALLHSICAFGIICSIIVHIYAALWVKGSIGAMVRGTVTYGWARKHHPKWFEAVMRNDKH